MGRFYNISASVARTLDAILADLSVQFGYREDAIGDQIGTWLHDMGNVLSRLQPLEATEEGSGIVELAVVMAWNGTRHCLCDLMVSDGQYKAHKLISLLWQQTPPAIIGPPRIVSYFSNFLAPVKFDIAAVGNNLTFSITGIGPLKAAVKVTQGVGIG